MEELKGSCRYSERDGWDEGIVKDGEDVMVGDGRQPRAVGQHMILYI